MPQEATENRQAQAGGRTATEGGPATPALVRHLRRPPLPGSFAGGERPAPTLRRDATYRRSLVLVDALAAGAAVVAIALLRRHSLESAIFFIVPLVVLLSKVAGLYERDQLVLRKTT